MNDKPPVIKLAQPGYNVKTAGDENLIYSSLWPLLKIYQQETFTVGDVTQATTVATHDLGFPPMFWFFSNATIEAYNNVGAVNYQNRSEFFGPVGDASIKINDSKLVYAPVATPATTGSMRFYYYIFALDLTKQYTAPIIKVGAQIGGRVSSKVFKLTKPDKDISSSNLQDYIIHSRARSPLIHSVNPSGGITKDFSVKHDLGYNPMFFGYTRGSDGYYTLIPTGTGGSSQFTSSETSVHYTDSGGQEITIVILKDPFNIDYSVRVDI